MRSKILTRKMLIDNQIEIIEDNSCVGNVKVIQRGKNCFITLNKKIRDKYRTKDILSAIINIDGQWVLIAVHRLVWINKYDDDDPEMFINHIDDDQLNCRINNLICGYK